MFGAYILLWSVCLLCVFYLDIPARQLGPNEKMDASIDGLSPGSQYRFRVRAVNNHGTGEPSDETGL